VTLRDIGYIDRLFAGLMAVWLAFLLNRQPGQYLSLPLALLVIAFSAFHVCQLQSGFAQPDLRHRWRTHVGNMVVIWPTAIALGAVSGAEYAGEAIQWARFIFIVGVVYAWILTAEAYEFFA
jgi:hypothetical protein